MKNHNNRIEKIKNWSKDNIIAIALVLLFYFIYIASLRMENAYFCFGTTGMAYMNGEYYRFLTCLFLHSGPRHLLANTLGLLSVSSLLSRFLGKGKTIFLFLSGGVLAEIAWSVVISDQIYDIGASSGIFALIACLIVCTLRFPDSFRFKWYRPDIIIVLVYFLFANSSVTAFLVHTFGFAAGILLSFVMVLTKALRKPADNSRISPPSEAS
ncbi:MAG: rhomboid family intramembrane serine protease [Lachnospiraceae bacterium]|nr:rhomboid family intramembrane serine protease [Lachnospiraceae bacterium]